MSDPIYIHAASRTMSYGYEPEDYGRDDMQQRLSHLLSIPAQDILEKVPADIDSIFVSNQLADKSGSEELIVNQLVDSLSLSDGEGRQYRLAGVTCLRIETATNGLAALRVALDHIQAGSGDTVLIVGGEKLTRPGFVDDEYRKAHFEEWAGEMVEYIASALAPSDRRYLRCMPAAMGLILNYYARFRAIEYSDLRELIQHLSKRAYRDVLANRNAFQRYRRKFRNRDISDVYDRDPNMNPVRVDPLRQLDMSPFNDGAGAILISRYRELRLRNRGSSVSDVVISGCAMATDRLELTQRKFLDFFPATRLAAKRAYAQAGLDLQDWQHKLAPLILEHHDAFVPLTLMNLEDLQLFADEKEVISYLKGTYLRGKDGPLWLNPSGGLLEGHPFAGTAIIKMVECFARLTSKEQFEDWAPAYKFDGRVPRTAVVQSFGGIGANVGVAVLDKCDESGKLLRKRNDRPYSNLATRTVDEKHIAPQNPRDGRIISVARIAMPFLEYSDEFKNNFDLSDQGPVEVLVALVETQQGRSRVYAFARRNSDEAKLRPEDICKKDVFVSLHETKSGYSSFSSVKTIEKSSFTLVRRVA